jgi:glycosyltransferase involved in cell wall biosynthesis
MTRVLHVPTVPWETSEAIARSCCEIAREQAGVTRMLVADRMPEDGVFEEVRVLDRWSPFVTGHRSFARAVRELEPDVVHLHGGTLAPMLALAPVLRGRTVVSSCYRGATTSTGVHVSIAERSDEQTNTSLGRELASRFGGRALAQRALRSGRVAIVCSSDLAVLDQFAGIGPTATVRGAARVASVQAEWSSAPRIVFAGRAQAGRGVDDLIAAFADVRVEVPSARLRLLLLPGPEADRWARHLAERPGTDVRIGAVPDLTRALADCQLAAFPFRYSATLVPALTAAEAMAVGLPVVATSVDCLAPLVDPGRNGWLVAPNDPRALGAAMLRTLRGPEVWQPLSEGARKTIDEQWSWASAAEAIGDVYERAKGGRL